MILFTAFVADVVIAQGGRERESKLGEREYIRILEIHQETTSCTCKSLFKEL
jgi:hypothetical protein